MYHGFYQLKQAPFVKHVTPDLFFPGGGRSRVLQHILDALGKGLPLIHLCGPKGAGKSHLCQLIRDKIHYTHTVVLLSAPTGSFDDIGRNIASALGEKDVNQLDGVFLSKRLELLISNRAEKGRNLLIIIDDVENLSSEVVKRLLGLSGEERKGGVQFLFAGKLALGANPELYSAIRDEAIEQFTYTLQPLDLENTAEYIAYRLVAAGAPDGKGSDLFTAGALEKIHKLTLGAIRSINEQAEEALQNAFKEKSSHVLQGHVGAKQGSAKPSLDNILPLLKSIKIPNMKVIGIVALAIVALIAVGSFVGKKSPKENNEVKGHVFQPPEGEIQSMTTPSQEVSENVELEGGDNHLVEESVDLPQQMVESHVILEVPEASLKTKPVNVTPVKITVDKNRTKRFTGNTILEKRKQATSNWRSRAQRGRYTIQVLMLESRNAERDLSQILDDDVYRNAQDDLYILEKNSTPMQIFLYYGAYQTAQEAREARDNLPDSLKKYTPFPLSIAAAIKKTRR